MQQQAPHPPTSPDPPLENAAWLEEIAEDDHDDSLIRWMLSLTPVERLKVAEGFAASVVALRRGRRR